VSLPNAHGLLLGREVARRLEIPDWDTIKSFEIVLDAGDVALIRVTRFVMEQGHVRIDLARLAPMTTVESFPLGSMLQDVGLALIEISKRPRL
jgi:hypothetical protein